MKIKRILKSRPVCTECGDLTYVSLEIGRYFGKNFCKNCLWESATLFELPSNKEVEQFVGNYKKLSPEEAFVLLCIKENYLPFASDSPRVLRCCEFLYGNGYLKKISDEKQDLYIYNL